MADLSAILQQAMANPQIMNQVAALAQSLGLQNGQAASAPLPEGISPVSPASEQAAPAFSGGAVPQFHMPTMDTFPQPDPRQLMGTLLQMSQRMGGDERQQALIQALKPFIRPERARKLERAIQIARMSRLAGQALGNVSKGTHQAGDFHV